MDNVEALFESEVKEHSQSDRDEPAVELDCQKKEKTGGASCKWTALVQKSLLTGSRERF